MNHLKRLPRVPCRLRVGIAWRYGTPYGMQGRASWGYTRIVQRIIRERIQGGQREIEVVWGRKIVGKEMGKGIKETVYM